MGRISQKSKKVSWPSDVNLCQVRLFSTEECPSKVATWTRDRHIQAKVKLSQIPLIKWKCPPKFEVNSDWLVVAGEESREIEAQNQREMRGFEAIYPRSSTIPSNPSAFFGSEEDSPYNEQNTPLVPLTPIEDDEDIAPNTSFNNMNPMMSQPGQHSSRGTFSSQSRSTINPLAVGPAINAATQATSPSFMPNNKPKNLIDAQLLIKILTDPKMVDQLLTNNHYPSPGLHSVPILPSSIPPYIPNIPSSTTPNTLPSTTHSTPSVGTQCIPNVRTALSRPISNEHFYPPSSIGSMGAKDINYYKSLIQLHGQERREISPQFAYQSCQPLNMMKSRESRSKIMRPCIYFNTPRGCRNGVNCPYQHDVASQKRASGVREVRSAKRVKFDREVTCS